MIKSKRALKWIGIVIFAGVCVLAGFFPLYWRWIDEPIPEGIVADSVVVLKSDRILRVHFGKEQKRYSVALGFGDLQDKKVQGDGRTPEGRYTIDRRVKNTVYYHQLHISYPTKQQRSAARAKGIDPGGGIFIHGLPEKWAWIGRFHHFRDWTFGCIALTNPEMDELCRVIRDGTPIEIVL